MEKIQWKVHGMDCSNCALTIRRYLEKQGVQDVKVNFATGDVSFELNGHNRPGELATGISELGYEVATQQQATRNKKRFLTTHLNYSRVYCWHELFWKKCMEKPAKWIAKYECVDHNRRLSFVCV